MKRILAVLILATFPLFALADPPSRADTYIAFVDAVNDESAVSEMGVSLLPVRVSEMVPATDFGEPTLSHYNRAMGAYKKPEVGWRS